MKKIFCIVALAIMCMATSFAQEEALKFKGIPIEGNINEFKTKLIDAGYKPYTVADKEVYAGQFTKEDCTIVLEQTNDHQIASVMVIFSKEYQSWQSINNAFNTLKEALITKYNCQPNDIEEVLEWADGETPDSDLIKFVALTTENCNHILKLKVKGGFISLAKTPAATLSLTYFSNKSAQKYNQEKYEDL